MVVLRTDDDLKEAVPKKTMITYRRGTNLKEKLVHSHYQTTPKIKKGTWLSIKGSYPCGDCVYCKRMRSIKEFINPVDNKKCTIRDYINCTTTGVVYAIGCSCPKIYVGKTMQELRKRMSSHFSDINKTADTSLSRHIMNIHKGDSSSLKIWGISKVVSGPRKGNIDQKLTQEEAKWIYRLKSLAPNGLNEGFTFASFL